MSKNNKYAVWIPFLVTAFIVAVEVSISFNSVLLPNIKDDFIISNQLAQMTISCGLFAIGAAGIVYGGLADTLGRRPIFLCAISIFTITTLICSFTKSIEAFLIARFFQGVGAGAGWIVGNSCLKDIYHGKSYVKVMNNVHAIAGITPGVAPVLGSYLGAIISWRACFFVLFLIAAVLAVLMCYFQQETLEEKKPTSLKIFITNYQTIFHSKIFLKYCAIKVIAVMTIFCEIANLPLIYVNHMQVAPEYFGIYMLPSFGCYIIAAIYSSFLLKKISIDAILKIGISLIAVSNLLILCTIPLNIKLTPIIIQAIKLLSYFGWGFIFGNATAMIVSSVPGRAGMASAIMMALEMFFSSVGIYGSSFFFDGTIFPLTITLFACAIVIFIPFVLIREKPIEHQ